MVIVWTSIILIAILFDVISTSFIGISFTLSGIITLIASKLGLSSELQVVMFIGLSVLFFLTLFPYMKKKFKVNKYISKEDDYVGKEFVISEDIDNSKISKIKINGIYWTVETNEGISKGDTIQIIEQQGNKYIAKKIIKGE